MENNPVSGRIFSIQRFCINDGPGIRTTVFFQGCPLHCLWCHNPESRCFEPRVSFRMDSCIACGKCKVLPPDSMCRRDPAKPCNACGDCVRECPGNALTLQGAAITVNEVMTTVLRDRFYYGESGGGLTLSGGEPCMQPGFAKALLQAAKKEMLHTAIETSGAADPDVLAALTEYCDLWLYDIKASPARYRELTGIDHARIRQNLQILSGSGAAIHLRVPLVQGGNLEEPFLEELKTLRTLPGVRKIELLPYHDMGRGKSIMCGLTEPDWERFSTPDRTTLDRWNTVLS